MQVKIWDPSLRGSELRATLKGHTRYFFTLFSGWIDWCQSALLPLLLCGCLIHLGLMPFLFCLICRTVRAISSDRGKVVSGSDDQSVLVWDKQTTQLLEELKGHDGQVCVLGSSFFLIIDWVWNHKGVCRKYVSRRTTNALYIEINENHLSKNQKKKKKTPMF